MELKTMSGNHQNVTKEIQLMTKGKDLFQKNQFKRALPLLEEVIEINPKNIDAFFIIGNIFHIMGQLGKAIKAFCFNKPGNSRLDQRNSGTHPVFRSGW